MKTIRIILIGMLCTFLVSCNKDEDNGSGGSNNGLKSGQIEFKAYPDKDNKISFFATAKKITIDWGDGTKDEFEPNGSEKEFIHEFSNQNFQTVSIVTESITSFQPSKSGKGTLHELRFGKCSELKDVYCSGQKLTVLDIKNAVTSLETLICGDNQLSSLDVSGASKLESLYCKYNQLTSIDVSNCTSLKSLDYSFYNSPSENDTRMKELNVKECASLTEVYCSYNEISVLDVSPCISLTLLDCSFNKISELNISKSTALTELNCGGNQLTSIDVSKCTSLTGLNCELNKLTTLNVSGTSLRQLICRDNQLSSLDISKCSLELLLCGKNQLTSLDISKSPSLLSLFCESNQLSNSSLNQIINDLKTISNLPPDPNNPCPYPPPYSGRFNFKDNPGTSSCDWIIAWEKGWWVFN